MARTASVDENRAPRFMGHESSTGVAVPAMEAKEGGSVLSWASAHKVLEIPAYECGGACASPGFWGRVREQGNIPLMMLDAIQLVFASFE